LPRLTVLMLRIALVYLALGFSFGGLLLFHKGIPLSPWLWSLLPAHIEFLLLGWTVQLAMGVAFWILPRFSREPKRGDERLAWLAFALLNLGVLLAGVGPLLGAAALLVFLGRAAEAGAALAFAVHAWPRVKAFGV
jgi:heme/copper-type cytochrome/quinol oxidase subunit 1